MNYENLEKIKEDIGHFINKKIDDLVKELNGDHGKNHSLMF